VKFSEGAGICSCPLYLGGVKAPLTRTREKERKAMTTTRISIAARALTAFGGVKFAEGGFYDGEQLADWFKVWAPSIATSVRVCPESYDSSEEWEFRDGSRLYVQNPAQAAFPCVVRLGGQYDTAEYAERGGKQ